MSDPASLISQAEKKLKGGFASFLSGGPKYEEASELYAQAANAYKLQQRWNDAAECFSKCASLQAKQSDQSQEAHFYVEMGNVLKKISTSDAAKYYEMAAKLYNSNGRFSQSAKLMKQIAELQEADANPEQAEIFYKKAADLFELDEYGKTSYTACILKYAELISMSKQPKYDEAIKIFESEGAKALKDSLVQFGAKQHFLKAGILQLAKGDAVTASIACERYGKMDPRFLSSREGQLLQQICQACEENDADKFVAALSEFDRITPLDPWKVQILGKVKASLAGGGATAGGKSGHHSADEEHNKFVQVEAAAEGEELDFT